MSITNEFFVYFQGEENYFLKIKASYSSSSNLFQLFGSFLNEFISNFQIKNRTIENTQLYAFDTISCITTLITQLSSKIPEKNYEYIIRPKEIIDESCSITATDSSIIDNFIDEGQIFESIGSFYTAYSFYSLTGKKGIPYLMKMFYNLKDFEKITKYHNELLPQYKFNDPFINEILGYSYEWQNNKSKSMETFSLFKNKQPIQYVAYNRLLFQTNPSKSRNQTKSFIEKNLLSCMKSDDIEFDIKSLFYSTILNIPARSEKVYTYEVIKMFIERSMWKEAIEYCVMNVRFFKYNLPLLAVNDKCASLFIDSISNPTLSIPVARQICSTFIFEDQINAALKLAIFLYNRNKRDVQSISLLMYVYYCMMKFGEIGKIAFDMTNYFPSDATIYDIQMGKILEKLLVVKKDLGIEKESQKKHNFFEQIESDLTFNLESANKELDPLRMSDRFHFIIFIIIYFFINHNTKEVTELLPDYYKVIRNATIYHDEIYEIFNFIAQIQINASTRTFFSNENRKICIVGDFTVFIYANTIFKIIDKAVKNKDDDNENRKKNNNNSDNQAVSYDPHACQQIWCLQALINQKEKGYFVQAEPFYVPEFSLWRIRDEKHGKKFISRAFEQRLKEIKDFLAKSKDDDDIPLVFAFGKRDIVKHIPNLMMKRKVTSIDELKNKYSSLFLNAIKKIRSFFPEKRIAVQMDYTDSKYLFYSNLLYEAISQNLPENVELTISYDDFKKFYNGKNFSFTVDNSLDILDIYGYNFYLAKSQKLAQNRNNNNK